MGKKVKGKGKIRVDEFQQRAKEEGYRSRAVYKLIQLNHKHGFLRSSRAVLDLCAAPGGWSQVAVRNAPYGCLVIALDLVRMVPIRGVVSSQLDITTPNCRATVKRLMEENRCRAFDLVLHDGSSNMGGAWSQEATTQNALVIDSLKLATEFLAPRGTFVTKIFRSRDYSSVLNCLKQLFDKVEVEKPAASRSTSAEIYLVGLKYKAPAKIDPCLLDMNTLFQDGAKPPKALNVLNETKHKRQPDGYDGEALVRKVCSATDFVWSDTPLEVLDSVTSISFEDPTCVPIYDHNLTTKEVKTQCEDLRVLSKQDIKHLIKWRLNIRKALTPKQKGAHPSTKVEPESKETEEDKMLNLMEELTYAMGREKKRAKKLLAEKDEAQRGTGMQKDAVVDYYGDQELFALSSSKQGMKDLGAVYAAESDEEIGDGEDSKNEDSQKQQPEGSSDEDSKKERRRYHEHLEKLLDQAYECYLEKKNESTKQRKWSKEKDSKDELYEGLSQGFSNKNGNDILKLLKSDSKDDMQVNKSRNQSFLSLSKEAKENEMQVNYDEPRDKILIPTKTKKSAAQEAKASLLKDDFEIAPAPVTNFSSYDSSLDGSDEEDNYSKAEILGFGKKLLRKKIRENKVENASNKHDADGLPKCFFGRRTESYSINETCHRRGNQRNESAV